MSLTEFPNGRSRQIGAQKPLRGVFTLDAGAARSLGACASPPVDPTARAVRLGLPAPRRWVARCVGAALVVLLLGATRGIAAPTPPVAPFRLGILAVSCRALPVAPIPADDGCRPTVGARFRVTTPSDGVLGVCRAEIARGSDPFAECVVKVPWGDTVVVTEDPASLPTGYTPRANPLSWLTAAEPPDGTHPAVRFVNVSLPAPTPPPTDGKPHR